MTEGHFSRRGFLAALAAGTAIAWLEAHASEVRAASDFAAASGDDWLVLTAEQAAVLDAVTAQIVPTDEHAGRAGGEGGALHRPVARRPG